MSLSELVKVVAPPNVPQQVGDLSEWAEYEARVGLALPDDYREFVFRYGTGAFAPRYSEIRVLNPFCPRHQERWSQCCETLQYWHDDGEVEQDIFPAIPGLFPVATDVERTILTWHTSGDPNHWPLVVYSDLGLKQFEMSLTSFLAAVLSNRLRIESIWSHGFKKSDRVFQSEVLE